jgi:hypothetical protein
MPTSPGEEYKKFIQSIEEQIQAADQKLREHAQNEINTNIAVYAKTMSARISSELAEMEKALEFKRYEQAEYHKMIAGIYKSALEAILVRR